MVQGPAIGSLQRDFLLAGISCTIPLMKPISHLGICASHLSGVLETELSDLLLCRGIISQSMFKRQNPVDMDLYFSPLH